MPISDLDDLASAISALRAEVDTLRFGMAVVSKAQQDNNKITLVFHEYVEQLKPLIQDLRKERKRNEILIRELLKVLKAVDLRLSQLQHREWENEMFAED